MQQTTEVDFFALLKVLVKHKVDFIVVGGLSAILQGVPLNTLDADVVHSRRRDNIQRLLAALHELDAWYRLRTDKKLSPKESHLVSPGHQLLATRHGLLDLLGTIGNGLAYEDLLPHSTLVQIMEGLRVRALKLKKLIEVKEQTGRDKDRAMLPTLRATLAEKKRLRK